MHVHVCTCHVHMYMYVHCGLSAEDIMSKDVKYLPLISKVETIDNLLRTTPHSAFPIVEDTISADVTVPMLYRGKRLISVDGSIDPSILDLRFLMKSPFENSYENLDEICDDCSSTEQLVLHGLILRSQLVTLLQNGVFIEESEQVSKHAHTLKYT